MKTVWVLVISVLFSVFVLAAPGGGRLPDYEYTEIMRWQVLAPVITIPEKEYTAFFSQPLTPEQIAELSQAGITLVSSYGNIGVLRGPATAFAAFGPGSEAFPWVQVLLPSIAFLPSTAKPPANFYAISKEDLLKATNADALQARGLTGEGVKVCVIDNGFTGELGTRLPKGNVHYLKIKWITETQPQFVEGYYKAVHGEACAEAIFNIAPKAEFFLISAPTLNDRLATYSLIYQGAIKVDLISDSTFYPLPLDHGDGKGPLGVACAELASEIPYFFAIGNMSACGSTDRGMYRTVYTDRDGTRGHDFDSQATDKVDRNTLAIEVKSSIPCDILVVLEWDGWPWQVKEDLDKPWTKEEVIRVQDVDLVVYYRAPMGSLSVVGKSDMNQFSQGGFPPLEYVYIEKAKSGTYLIQVANVSDMHNISGVFTRPVEFNVLVYVMGEGEMTLEHCTREGTVFNMAAAENVVCVGAVGWAGAEWCVMPFSSQGPTSDGRLKPELVAPNGYFSQALNGPFGGTSAAAPVVAGGAALLLQANPKLSPQGLLETLIKGATKLCGSSCNGQCLAPNPYNYLVGWGLVNFLKCYELVR